MGVDLGQPAAREPGGASTDRELVRTLCTWFAGAARDLPWRRDPEPYAVWICEAMCQQTRIETVLPYWRRFLSELPTPRALAEVSEDRLLALWSGLGYYSRARRLREAAKVVVRDHGGELPRTAVELLRLPGIGPYTAGAVASIAFGERAPLVDGNVARVLARLEGIDEPLGSGPARRRFERRAAQLIAHTTRGRFGPGAWNQSLMELGALVCTPRKPNCPSCPLRSSCVAAASDEPERWPVPAPRPAPIDVELEVWWLERSGRVALVRRPPEGRMAGLFELPTREVSTRTDGATHLWPAELPLEGLREVDVLGEISHGITRHRIRARVVRGTVAGDPARVADADVRWLAVGEAADLPLTGLAKKLLARDFGRRARPARGPGG